MENASEQKLGSASFEAIDALSSVSLGWLNWETKRYETVGPKFTSTL
jgi:hypothetical protein